MGSDAREVYGFNEGSLYIWQGASSAIMAYAEDVSVTVDDTYRKFLFQTTGTDFGLRSQYVLTDHNVKMTVGRLFAGQSALFGLMQSAVNISAAAVFTGLADGSVDKFVLFSARISNYGAQGREGQIWKDGITIIAPDLSAS